jgi:hypothetical protein
MFAMKRHWAMWGLLVCGLTLFALGAAAQSPLPAADDLQPGWNRLEPAGATCGNGSPYAFFVRPGDPAKLTVNFQGGGACWDRATCGPLGPFDRSVGDAEGEIGAGGLFDFEDPRNPIADHTVVFVSYCTGDVHTGGRTMTFEGDPALTMQFRGYDNATLILDWMQANYPNAEQVFVTGTSAGAYGALFNAARIFAAYPTAQHRVLGDAGVGVTPPDWQGFDQWGMADHLPTDVAFGQPDVGLATALAEYTAAAFPEAQVAQYTTVADGTQAFFYGLMGGQPDTWTERMRTVLGPLEAIEGARLFLAPGALHGILPRPEYYSVTADGVALADWLPAWLAGEDVPSVLCADCE